MSEIVSQSNCSTQTRSPAIQAKLTVSHPADAHEQEADRVANAVMRMRASSAQVRRKEQVADAPSVTPAVAANIDGLRGGGGALPTATRAFFEPRFGTDFSSVRVHTGTQAQEAAQSIGAKAFTLGNDISFSSGQYSPDSGEGRTLLAHELTHVVQQRDGAGERIQRAPAGGAASLTLRESLEVVAQRIARLAIAPSSAVVNLKGGPDKVVSVVRNIRTGQMYVGLNTGQAANVADVIAKAIDAQKARIAAGELQLVRTAANAVGGHAEVNALSTAILEEEAALGVSLTEEALQARFEVHNVWLSGKHKLETAPRCEHCARITRGVTVTEALFKAEGGVSGEIDVPQRGKALKTGGVVMEANTLSGEISSTKPVKPPTAVPETAPKATPEVKIPARPSGAGSAIKSGVVRIGANVLLFAVTYYINKWFAEKQVEQFNDDLTRLLPDINTRLQNKEAEILKKQTSFPLVYGNITVRYTKDQNDLEDYNAVSMTIQDVAISHQNYQTPERSLSGKPPYLFDDPAFALTFSVPLFEEKTAEIGASSLVRNYRQVRENLTYPGMKARLSAVIALYNLAKQDASLTTLVVRDLLGMLQDQEAIVRLVAVKALQGLTATIAIEYIKAVLPITKDVKHKELIERYLRELEAV